MATTAACFDSGHADMVHDVQVDYYGKRIASCSSDRTVKVFDVTGDQPTHLADLTGHEGPVWQVAWAHPKFGSLIASCSFDHRTIVWKETHEGVWTQVYSTPLHTASVNSVAFGPHELGLCLASGSSDGSISLVSYHSDSGWTTEKIPGAHTVGCMAVSWAPAPPAAALKQGGPLVRRLASCGCDNSVKVWVYSEAAREWQQQGATLAGHSDWVRDVAWAPAVGLPDSVLASAGQDGKVFIWYENQEGGWDSRLLHDFGTPVWRVSWSVTGRILATTDGRGEVTLWKEALDGAWQQLNTEEAAKAAAS